jgi:hypothetical protein
MHVDLVEHSELLTHPIAIGGGVGGTTTEGGYFLGSCIGMIAIGGFSVELGPAMG